LSAQRAHSDCSLAILTYHALDDQPSVISMPPAAFRGQVEALARRGLRGVSLAQAFEQREREGRFPQDAVVLTFDDGYLSVITAGLPLLAAHGFTATVFLASGLVGLTAAEARRRNPDLDRDLLDWGQATELLQAGWEIGSHTVSHPDLTRLDTASLARELGDSKLELEQRLQAPVRSFAYPYGRHKRSVRDAAAHYYDFACTTRLAHHAGVGDSLRIDRIDMYYMQDPDRFARLLDDGLVAWLNLRRTLRAVKRLAQGANRFDPDIRRLTP
jgi:peptidoglycan/xylan/chitin deacetylase (PgdA/CDA1 family)